MNSDTILNYWTPCLTPWWGGGFFLVLKISYKTGKLNE